jgi:uncharacterized cupredoxin-like copper-binding protein
LPASCHSALADQRPGRTGKKEHNYSKPLAEVTQDKLPSGATATIQPTFPKAGQYEFACHTPGHYKVGTVLPIAK